MPAAWIMWISVPPKKVCYKCRNHEDLGFYLLRPMLRAYGLSIKEAKDVPTVLCISQKPLYADPCSSRKGVAGVESPRDQLRPPEEPSEASAFCAALRNKRDRFKKAWDLPSPLGLV